MTRSCTAWISRLVEAQDAEERTGPEGQYCWFEGPAMALMCPGYGSSAGTARGAVEMSSGDPLSFSSDARKEAKKRAGVLGAGGARSLSRDL
jgi:hypothetical protein